MSTLGDNITSSVKRRFELEKKKQKEEQNIPGSDVEIIDMATHETDQAALDSEDESARNARFKEIKNMLWGR